MRSRGPRVFDLAAPPHKPRNLGAMGVRPWAVALVILLLLPLVATVGDDERDELMSIQGYPDPASSCQPGSAACPPQRSLWAAHWAQRAETARPYGQVNVRRVVESPPIVVDHLNFEDEEKRAGWANVHADMGGQVVTGQIRLIRKPPRPVVRPPSELDADVDSIQGVISQAIAKAVKDSMPPPTPPPTPAPAPAPPPSPSLLHRGKSRQPQPRHRRRKHRSPPPRKTTRKTTPCLRQWRPRPPPRPAPPSNLSRSRLAKCRYLPSLPKSQRRRTRWQTRQTRRAESAAGRQTRRRRRRRARVAEGAEAPVNQTMKRTKRRSPRTAKCQSKKEHHLRLRPLRPLQHQVSRRGIHACLLHRETM